MKFTTEDIGRLLASGRGYAQAGVGLVFGVGLTNAAQNKGFIDSITEMYNGLMMVIHGATSFWQIAIAVFGPLASFALAKWSSNSAKTVNQSASVNAAVKEAVADNKPIPLVVKANAIDTAAQIPEVKENNPTIKVGDPKLANAVPAEMVVAK